jgi:hypothetical protein
MRVFAVAILLGLAGSGCTKSPAPRSAAKGSTAQSSARQSSTVTSAASQRCQTLLSSALEMLRPEKLGISAEPKAAVDTLNNWVRDCGKTLPAENSPAPDPAAEKLISAAARTAANGDLYDRQDIEHVRDCWLFKQARTNIVHQYDSDPARAVALFDFACRIVGLNGKTEPTIPQNLYDAAVIGKGSPEDRAWVFGELLRQTGLDAVILKPAVKKTGETRWLVGVPIDKQVYLFDPTLGWPIPSPADKGTTAAVESAATLAQVLADDKLLRKLDVSADKPYPLHSDDLKSARVEIITSSRYSSPRIRRLESFLSGDRSVTIYAPLGDMGSRPGLLSRVANAAAGSWKKEDIGVWEYPDRQTAAINHLDPQAAEIRGFLWLPFQGPVTAEFDKEHLNLNISPGTHKQIKSRVAQLQGDYAGAVRNYLLVQLDELPPMLPLPPEMQAAVKAKQQTTQEGTMAVPIPKLAFATNFRAAEDAKFWMAVCQYEQNMLEPANETLDAYWRRYIEGGKWIPQTALLRGLTLAKSGKYALAVQQINEIARAIPEDDPRWATCQLFTTRWRAARDAANAQGPDSQAANSTAQPKPESKQEASPPAKTGEPSTKLATSIPVKPATPTSPPNATPPKSTPATPPKTKTP